jgi:hypothetical protein
MVELAGARAAEQGLATVHFKQEAIDAITLDEPVDAVVGRLILSTPKRLRRRRTRRH